MDKLSEKEMIFQILQAKYMLHHKYRNLFEAFDIKWLKNNNIEIKTKILYEALKKGNKVCEISEYNDIDKIDISQQ